MPKTSKEHNTERANLSVWQGRPVGLFVGTAPDDVEGIREAREAYSAGERTSYGRHVQRWLTAAMKDGRMRVSPKVLHEVRDPIHGFIHFNNLERDLLNTAPVQRLRHIHQLAMTYQVYPGATHRRFEHSLGVMDLAGRAFDSLMRPEKLPHGAGRLPEAADDDERRYWRRVLRVAALVHDVGHMPFSHAAEEHLLPQGWTHEHLTRECILHSDIKTALESARPPIRPEDVVKLALEPDKQPDTALSPWEAILNEIITGATFGVDRMDYLLRDSYHAGVPYGRFDPLRLLDSLIIIRREYPLSPMTLAPEDANLTDIEANMQEEQPVDEPDPENLTLGIQEGGIHGAEALLLARYFMYTQVYFHHVRRSYDVHLQDFMQAWLLGQGAEDRYPTKADEHVAITDNEVLAALLKAAQDADLPGFDAARRVVERDHFRTAYRIKQADLSPSTGHPNAADLLRDALREQFGVEPVRVDSHIRHKTPDELFVLQDDGSIASGLSESDVLAKIPPAWFGYVLCTKEITEEVRQFLKNNKTDILQSVERGTQ